MGIFASFFSVARSHAINSHWNGNDAGYTHFWFVHLWCSQMGIGDERGRACVFVCVDDYGGGWLNARRDGQRQKQQQSETCICNPIERELNPVSVENASRARGFHKVNEAKVQHKQKQQKLRFLIPISKPYQIHAPSPKHIHYIWWKSLCLRAQGTRTKQYRELTYQTIYACSYLCFAFGWMVSWVCVGQAHQTTK